MVSVVAVWWSNKLVTPAGLLLCLLLVCEFDEFGPCCIFSLLSSREAVSVSSSTRPGGRYSCTKFLFSSVDGLEERGEAMCSPGTVELDVSDLSGELVVTVG